MHIEELVERKIGVLSQLLHREQKFSTLLFPKQVHLYLDDVRAHIVSIEQRLPFLGDVLNGAHSLYLGRINLELNANLNSSDDIAKKVSLFFFSASRRFSNIFFFSFLSHHL